MLLYHRRPLFSRSSRAHLERTSCPRHVVPVAVINIQEAFKDGTVLLQLYLLAQTAKTNGLVLDVYDKRTNEDDDGHESHGNGQNKSACRDCSVRGMWLYRSCYHDVTDPSQARNCETVKNTGYILVRRAITHRLKCGLFWR